MEQYIPSIIIAATFAAVKLVDIYVGYKARKNPEQDIWDHIYKVTETAANFVEQNFRPTFGNKLDKSQANQLFKLALDRSKKMLSDDIKNFLMGNTHEATIDDILGSLIESHVRNMK